jgi:hypothetical protein
MSDEGVGGVTTPRLEDVATSRCAATRKVTFLTAKAAKAVARGGRVYPCDACGGWHITREERYPPGTIGARFRGRG